MTNKKSKKVTVLEKPEDSNVVVLFNKNLTKEQLESLSNVRTNFRYGYKRHPSPDFNLQEVMSKEYGEGIVPLEECKKLTQFDYAIASILADNPENWDGGWTYTIYQKGEYKNALYQVKGFY